MVASVTALTCHVTTLMGLSMAPQTAVSQEPASWLLGESGETMGRQGLMIKMGGHRS